MRKIIFVLVMVLMSSALYSQQITIKESADILNLLIGNYKSLDSYRAKFIQRSGRDVYKGDIYYKSPDMFKIVYRTPSSKVALGSKHRTIVSDGKTLWTYMPRLYAASEQDINSKTGTYLNTKAGLIRLKEEYYFRFFDNNRTLSRLSDFRHADFIGYEPGNREPDDYLASDNREAYHMYLRPIRGRTLKAGFSALHLWIDHDGLIIRSLGRSTSMQVIEFVFTDIERNAAISDSEFDFDVPAGVQVIRNNFFDPQKGLEEEN